MIVQVGAQPSYFYTGGVPFDRSLPTVLLVHGAQHDHSVWGLQSRYLAHHGFGVLACDLPGHGRSAGHPLPSVEALADWLAAACAALGVDSSAVVGHSMGSLVALELALRRPHLVSRLALVATAYPMTVSEALLAATRDDEAAAIDMINRWSHSTAFGGFSHKPGAPAPGFVVPWANKRLMQRQSPGVLHVDFVACNAYRNGANAAAAVRVPALFVLGEADAMTAAKSGRALAAQVAGAEVVLVPGSGHALMTETPDAVLDALRPFLAQARTVA